jgi:hypothetical protein
MFSNLKKIPSCQKEIPKEINNDKLGLIELFISKISPNYVVFTFTMETKVKYIDLSIIRKNDIKNMLLYFL